jgi:serine/threonine protein kinase
MTEAERQPTIKLCDFTTSSILPTPESLVQTQAGTLAFNAPEQFEKSEFSPKPLDVWAYGMSIWVYLTDNLPYEDV